MPVVEYVQVFVFPDVMVVHGSDGKHRPSKDVGVPPETAHVRVYVVDLFPERGEMDA